MGNLVDIEISNQIGLIRMNRPEKLNALSREMVDELLQALEEMSASHEVKVIILAGEGKSFCAGGDIESMNRLNNPNGIVEWIDYVSSLTQTIMKLDKYVIAAVHGYAAGAGFSLALAADFIVAQSSSKFALSFANIGLIPDLGLIKALTERVSPPIVKEWISSAKVLSAKEAYAFQMINLITEESVVDAAKKYAHFILNGPPISNKYVKYLVNHVGDLHLETAFKQENMIQAFLLQTEDHKEGVASFFEKRVPKFKGK